MKTKKKKDKKAKSILPTMQYFFKKQKNHNELITIIDNRVMIKVAVSQQDVGVILSFDKEQINDVKKGKYKKVSLEIGIDYVVNIGCQIEAICDAKITRGLEFLMRELVSIAIKRACPTH